MQCCWCGSIFLSKKNKSWRGVRDDERLFWFKWRKSSAPPQPQRQDDHGLDLQLQTQSNWQSHRGLNYFRRPLLAVNIVRSEVTVVTQKWTPPDDDTFLRDKSNIVCCQTIRPWRASRPCYWRDIAIIVHRHKCDKMSRHQLIHHILITDWKK